MTIYENNMLLFLKIFFNINLNDTLDLGEHQNKELYISKQRKGETCTTENIYFL